MGNKVIALKQIWWVWIGNDPAVKVETEDLAREILLAKGSGLINAVGRTDQYCAVALLTWDKPLPEGKSYHKPVLSPVSFVLCDGIITKTIQHYSPSRVKQISKSWLEQAPEFQWWTMQYNQAKDAIKT